MHEFCIVYAPIRNLNSLENMKRYFSAPNFILSDVTHFRCSCSNRLLQNRLYFERVTEGLRTGPAIKC